MSQELRLKNIDETRNHFLEEIMQIELMSRKHEKVCTTLNYTELFFILDSTITGQGWMQGAATPANAAP